MAPTVAEEEVKLVGIWASPFVIRTRIALNIKGVTYEFLEETFGSKSELLLKSNPVYKKIPVLIHHGKPICESMIIVQYIDDVWATTQPSILSADPHERAFARFWAVYIDDKLLPSLFGIVRATTKEAKEEATDQAFAGLQLLEEVFENHCKEKLFFGGETIGYIDIALGCLLGWIGAANKIAAVKLLDDAKTPQLVGWAERFWSQDAVNGVIPNTEQFVEFAEMVRARISAKPTK